MKKGAVRMFEYINASTVGKDGIERITAKVNPCRFDNDGLINGKVLLLTNNYIKNNYKIEEFRLSLIHISEPTRPY